MTYNSTFSIDGTFAPWGNDLTCGIPMWEAGDSDKVVGSQAFLNWDCNTGELCILVKATEGNYLQEDPDIVNMWFKDYGQGNSPQETLGDGLQTIREVDTDTGNGNITAWEACYSMPATCFNEVEIHTNFFLAGTDSQEGRTASTGKASARIALDLYCPCDTDAGCEIDKCYALSKCESQPKVGAPEETVGVCEYSAIDNCCVDNEGCEVEDTCIIEDGKDTGICQYISPTPPPTPAPTGPPVATSLSPTATGTGGGVSTPTPTIFHQCLVDENCVIQKGHSTCAVAKCNMNQDGNTCGEVADNEGEQCDTKNASEYGNTCYQPICEGIYCKDAYLSVNASCEHSDSGNECVDYKCQADADNISSESERRTTCEPVFKIGTKCNTGRESNGKYSRLNLSIHTFT